MVKSKKIRGPQKNIILLITKNPDEVSPWAQYLERRFEVRTFIHPDLGTARETGLNGNCVIYILRFCGGSENEVTEKEFLGLALEFPKSWILGLGDLKYKEAVENANAQGFINSSVLGVAAADELSIYMKRRATLP